MLTQAGFELAPSRYRSDALPIELVSPMENECANSTTLSDLRFVVNNLTLDISIGEDSTVFRLDLNYRLGSM